MYFIRYASAVLTRLQHFYKRAKSRASNQYQDRNDDVLLKLLSEKVIQVIHRVTLHRWKYMRLCIGSKVDKSCGFS